MIRCSSLVPLLIVTLTSSVMLLSSPSTAANANDPKETPQSDRNSMQSQSSITNQRGWSKKRKLATAVVVGCVIATAIAVPVAVSVHHRTVLRRQSRRRNLAGIVIANQEIAATRQEQALSDLLNHGPALNLAQQTTLQTALANTRQAESMLKQAFNEVQMHHNGAAIALDRSAGAVLKNSEIISHSYDGISDFPNYPINVLSDLNVILGHH
jgi:hypothetical protein